MNSVMETILTRRSIRKFIEKPIEKEKLDAILQAAIHAPSGMGRQTWQFTVISDRKKSEQLYRIVGKFLDDEKYDFYNAEVLVLPSNLRESPWGPEDNACAMENMFLAAHSLGLGSVWINQLRKFNHEMELRTLLTEYGIPVDHVIYGIAALGYADPSLRLKEIERIGVINIVKNEKEKE